MAESAEPRAPDEAAARRALAARPWRRHQWIAVCWRVCVSVHATVILAPAWDRWPPHACDPGPLAVVV